MKIAFDSQIFTLQEYGGISRYVCSLAAQLAAFQGVEAKIFAPLYINAYLDTMPRSLVSGMRVPIIPKTRKIFHISSQFLARTSMVRFAPQIVHETYYSRISPVPNGARRVITVYDMIHERFASLFSEEDRTSMLKRESITRADHVICISENTRRDLLDLIQIPPEKVSVVYLGFDQLGMPVDQNGTSALVFTEMPYLLYVGGRDEYKNFKGLLQAYASSNWLRNNVRIICFGGGPLQVGELAQMQKLGISNQQVEQVNGSDEKLARYYRNAAAFVYPSRYEGFGIPPLEAMSLQCPVICSNTSSIPEVVEDAGEYFEPDNIESIRVAIERVLQSTEKRDYLIRKGAERCMHFTWERCASETLAIYRSIV